MPTVEAPPYFFPGWDAGTVATTSLTFGTGSETLNLSLPVLTPAALDAVSLASPGGAGTAPGLSPHR